ncbi:MAG: hypothetical protein H0T62_02630 [Parachlamydiaceae bacterium]|nr:hypothetical protein [Parachlamydiaceae bacterium]
MHFGNEMREGQSEISFKGNKARFERAIDKWIESQLNLIDFESEWAENKLVSPAIKRAQKKNELREDLKKNVRGDLLIRASEIVHIEGREILGNDQYEHVENTFEMMAGKFEELDLDGEITQNFKTLLNVDDRTIEGLEKIAINLFTANRFTDCIAISMLLYALVPEDLHYLFRAGIAAQNDGNKTLALEAYSLVLSIDPSAIGAHLFSGECYPCCKRTKRSGGLFEKGKRAYFRERKRCRS